MRAWLRPHLLAFGKGLISLVEFVVKLTVIGGIVFTALQYRDSKKKDRVDRTTTYVDRYEAGDTSKAARDVSRALRDFSQREDYRALALQAKQDPEIAASANRGVAMMLAYQSRDGAGLVDQLDELVGFYNSLDTCVAAKLCDAAVAHAFFDRPARSLWINFLGYFEDRRTTSPEYAAGLEHLVGGVAGASDRAP